MYLKPFHIKNHVWVFVNCSIENPSFDSQTKENMTLKAKSFVSTCALSDKFIKSVSLTCLLPLIVEPSEYNIIENHHCILYREGVLFYK